MCTTFALSFPLSSCSCGHRGHVPDMHGAGKQGGAKQCERTYHFASVIADPLAALNDAPFALQIDWRQHRATNESKDETGNGFELGAHRAEIVTDLRSSFTKRCCWLGDAELLLSRLE